MMGEWAPIPGETPIDDLSGLIPKHVRARAQLNAVEAVNIGKAALKYLAAKPSSKTAPFTLSWCFGLHKEMFGEVWSWAGTKRKTQPNIGVPVHQIEIQMQGLLDDLSYWRKSSSMDLFEQAARLHHKAVWVHPFPNGNGRWSRMLASILLRQHGFIEAWPNETIGTASIIRDQYLAAVRAADIGDYGPLIEMHRRYSS